MEQIAHIFPAAKRVTDRFHVQELAYEAVQEMRLKESSLGGFGEESTQIFMQGLWKDVSAPVFVMEMQREAVISRSLSTFTRRDPMWPAVSNVR